MARTETVVTPTPKGAGRSLDWMFPANILQVFTNALGNTWINRQGTILTTMGSNTGFGVPPAGSGWTVFKGRIAHRQTAGGGGGGFFKTDGSFGLSFPQTKDAAGANYLDDFRCWRLVYIAAYDASISGFQLASDGCLEVGAGFNFDVITGVNDGLGIRPTGNGSVGVFARKGGALTINQNVVTSGVDTRDYNAYEMRLIGATPTLEAVWKCFLNGRPVFSASWGAGTLLPTLANGASLAYSIGLGNRGLADSVYTAMNGLHVIAAATEDALI